MDYKQSEVTGVRWRRFSNVNISNPRNGAPTVSCTEQEVVAIADGEIVYGIGNLDFPFDPNFTFPILNPVTNEPTANVGSGAAVYALIYSYVLAKAVERDNLALQTAAAQEAAQAAAAADRQEALRLSAEYLASRATLGT